MRSWIGRGCQEGEGGREEGGSHVSCSSTIWVRVAASASLKRWGRDEGAVHLSLENRNRSLDVWITRNMPRVEATNPANEFLTT